MWAASASSSPGGRVPRARPASRPGVGQGSFTVVPPGVLGTDSSPETARRYRGGGRRAYRPGGRIAALDAEGGDERAARPARRGRVAGGDVGEPAGGGAGQRAGGLGPAGEPVRAPGGALVPVERPTGAGPGGRAAGSVPGGGVPAGGVPPRAGRHLPRLAAGGDAQQGLRPVPPPPARAGRRRRQRRAALAGPGGGPGRGRGGGPGRRAPGPRVAAGVAGGTARRVR